MGTRPNRFRSDPCAHGVQIGYAIGRCDEAERPPDGVDPIESTEALVRPAERQTQRQVLDELEVLVAGEGLAELTMAEIAAEVNCSLRTLYGISPSKDELLLTVVDRRLHRIGRKAHEALDASLSALDALRAYLHAVNEAVQPTTVSFARDFAGLPGAKRLLDAHEGPDPFFLYLHFMDVHEYAAPPEFKNFGGGQEGTYLAAIRWVDDVLQRVRERLDREGLSARTVMIFASDHGEAFGENRTHGHARNVFTPVLHVPLLIRFPFSTGPVRVHTQVRNLDIAPTVLDIAGVDILEDFEGESLLPLIAAPGGQPDRPSFAALGAPILVGAVEQVSVNDGSWSLARNLDEEGREFLFERALDPQEDANLVDLEPAAAQRMRAVLDAHLSVRARSDTRATNVRIDPKIAERLRAVGYLQ